MPLGREVGIGDIVLDGDPVLPRDRGTVAPTFRPVSIVAKRLDGLGYLPLCMEVGIDQATLR